MSSNPDLFVEHLWPWIAHVHTGHALAMAREGLIGQDVAETLTAGIDRVREQPAIDAWTANWIAEGFAALEQMIERHGGRFAFGDTLTLADCHLVPQYYSAQRFAVDCTPHPRLVAAVENALAVEAVAAAHPDRQPDADAP